MIFVAIPGDGRVRKASSVVGIDFSVMWNLSAFKRERDRD